MPNFRSAGKHMAKKKRKHSTKKRSQKRKTPKATPTVNWPLGSFESVNLRLLIVLLLGVTFLAMSPVITNDFISLDDETFILKNQIVQKHQVASVFKKQLYRPHYKPLVYLTWIVEHRVAGDKPFLYHFDNL